MLYTFSSILPFFPSQNKIVFLLPNNSNNKGSGSSFSGIFSKRNEANIIQHSNLLVLDFDHIANVEDLKQKLLQDQYFETELLFISPSGDGLKWVIPINIHEAVHQDYYRAVKNYIKATYNLDVDQSGKDVCRACFLPYDKEAYINPKYKI